MTIVHQDIDERFKSHINYVDGHWLWTAHIGKKDGYGYFGIGSRTDGSRRKIAAHRWAYVRYVGKIPEGLQIDHLCRVRECANPAHLEAVTCRENLLRGDTVTAHNANKTHCVNGHEYTPENTAITRDGCRRCRICHRADSNRWSKKQQKLKEMV